MAQGKSLELYFIDGDPDGMLTAEVFNWTGLVLSIPRTQIVEGLKRPEASYTGVYILIGENDDSPLAYVGEGENISNRIKNHDANKDWWSQAVLVTASANNLNKAHVQYLESRLIELARSSGRIELENGTSPGVPGLTESAQSNMEGFLEYLLMVLPAIRVDLFTGQKRPETRVAPSSASPEFVLTLKKDGIEATAILQGSEFVVQAGSMSRNEWIGDRKHNTHYWKLFDDLVEKGVLVPDGSHRRFSESYAFSSTSAAGAVVTGRSTAGPTAWKLRTSGKTYKAWEAERLSEG